MANQRLTWLTRRPSLWSAVVPLVALAAGMLFALSAATARGTDLRSSASDLPGLIRDQTRQNAVLAGRLAQLRAEVDRLSARQAPGDLRVTQLTRQADRLTVAAGTQAVSGPTVQVSLTDAKNVPAVLPDGISVDDYVVHQQDVQGVVNALWQGGAEAMMLMDQRVISTSAVRCVGNTVVLHGRVYSPPFVVSAIGDPERLRTALDEEPGVEYFRTYVDRYDLGYSVRTGDLHLPAYDGPLELPHVTRGR